MSGPSELQALLDEGAASSFPQASAVVVHRGATVFQGSAGGAGPSTIYDLASLTKVLCTAPLFMKLWAAGAVGPDSRLARQLPGSQVAEADVTFADLLYHRSGLPAFVPYFAPVMRAVPELLMPSCPSGTRKEIRAEVIAAARRTPFDRPCGQAAVYSDVGFILLGEALSQLAGKPLDAAYQEHLSGPLGLSIHFRPLSAGRPATPEVAATGQTRPREPAPGQEGMWSGLLLAESRTGEVDDDNAWVLDGVAGHAGLFGTAADVARFGQRVLEELSGAGRLAPAPLWRRACQVDGATPGSTRALGWDTPSPQGYSSAGRALRTAVGHTGFTGVSLWIDLERELVVSLCTNRTLLGRANLGIRDFRPRFHDRVVELL